LNFFKNLNFSSSNEDGDTEIAALTGANRILCITGSGTRPMDLLMTDAAEVIAFDVNPSQNALLSLKIAAIQCLDHADFLAFQGITQGDRPLFYKQLRGELTPDMQSYWDRRQGLISRGVWYAGKWEKLLYWNALFLRLVRGKAINELLAAKTVAEQSQIWEAKFNDSKLRRAIEMIGRDWVWRWVMREPAGEFLPSPQEVGARLEGDFTRSAHSFLFRDSDFATLIFKGRIDAKAALPTHLRPENYDTLRDRLSRLRIVEGNLTDIASHGIDNVEGFSLSDFGSYCGPDIYAACWQGVMDVAAEDARFCERIFMNDMDAPFARIQVDTEMSDVLTHTDKAIIYKIRAGRIS